MTTRKPTKKRAPAKKAAKGKAEPKPEKVKRKRGRPSVYTEDVAEEILMRLENGESLIAICQDDHLPHESTVRKWVTTNKPPEFGPKYAKSREIGYARLADELLGIADDGINDFVLKRLESGESVLVPDREHIMRSRLRVDTRKWLLSKCLPKIFGDKVALTGADGGPIETRQTIDVTKLSTETLKRIREELGGDSDPA